WAHTYPSSGLGPEYFRGALGLRSSRFALGVLDAIPGTTKSVCGARLRIDALAREMNRFKLQQRPTSGGSWTNFTLRKDDSAHYHAVGRPCRGMSYRMHSPAANTAPESVRVAAKIVFSDTQPANDGLRGKVRPIALSGQATAHVDRLKNGSWVKNVATAAVGSDGRWHV